MIEYIESLDRVTAAGILARAALALENRANPAAAPLLPNEHQIREDVIRAARKRAGIEPADNTHAARERLCDELDEEREALLSPHPDNARVLRELAVKGELPSDLYNIDVISNIRQFHGRKFETENRYIEDTVRAPDFEQHYGPTRLPNQPHLISLFAKTFPDKYPARTFIMLVAGGRDGLNLTVHQAWRIYPEEVDLVGSADPLEMLKRFANVYGADVTFGNERGRFILLAEVARGQRTPVTYNQQSPGEKPRLITISHFQQEQLSDGGKRSALVVAIDLDKYRATLTKHGW
jgi:hypothetical protein